MGSELSQAKDSPLREATAAPHERIAKVKSTMLGYEDHGILTVWLDLDYGGSGQGAGGYGLDEYDKTLKRRVGHAACGEFIAGVLRACGVRQWEKVEGRTVLALIDGVGWGGKVIGLAPLPTEPGSAFIFADAFADLARPEGALTNKLLKDGSR